MNPTMLRFAVLGFVFFSFSLAWAENRQNEAKIWLERMMHASQTLNYEGTFVYVQGHKLEAMHIIHRSGDDGERQRLYSLNGSMREVLVTNDLVTCLLPGQRVQVVGTDFTRSTLPVSLPRDLYRLEESYRLDMLGNDRTAGLDTRVVEIQPQDAFRFGYRLWLDSNTGMVLRSALLDENGHILEQMMFTSIELGSEIDLTRLSPPKAVINAFAKPSEHPRGVAVGESNWAVTRLPRGFEQVLHKRFTKAPSSETEHIVFTDGLATVSVFVENLQGTEPVLNGASRMGAMNAFGLVIDDYQVMVVGEVPVATVEMIGSSMEFRQEATQE
jgi:sigma-E factor negative regulatory protein RseB